MANDLFFLGQKRVQWQLLPVPCLATTTLEIWYRLTSYPLRERGIAHLFLRDDDACSDIVLDKLHYTLSMSAG